MSCEQPIEDQYVNIGNSFQNEVLPILKSYVENEKSLNNTTIFWKEIEVYRKPKGYFITVPVFNKFAKL